MVVKKKLLTLGEMTAIAKDATREALRGHDSPEHRENLTLGSQVTASEGIFELYLAGELPSDARVISRAVVNRQTGVVDVEVFLNPSV